MDANLIEKAVEALRNSSEDEITEIYMNNLMIISASHNVATVLVSNVELKRLMKLRSDLNDRNIEYFKLDATLYELVNRTNVNAAINDIIALSDALYNKTQTVKQNMYRDKDSRKYVAKLEARLDDLELDTWNMRLGHIEEMKQMKDLINEMQTEMRWMRETQDDIIENQNENRRRKTNSTRPETEESQLAQNLNSQLVQVN